MLDDAYSDPWNSQDPYADLPVITPPSAAITWGSLNPPQNVPGGWQDSHTGGFTPANNPYSSGPQDLSYWASRGVPADQIFDFATGQTRPGWSRTAQGYERTGGGSTPPSVGPTYDTIPTTYGGGGGPVGDWGYLTEPYGKTAPGWHPGPGFAPPTFAAPPPFSYKEFQAPTTDSIYADPSYKFRFGEGERAVEQSAAGRGVLRTGGTLKDIANYGQNAASQEYSNIFKRATDVHNMGLQQALGTYGTNYGVSRDVYDRLYQGNKATFDAQQRENELLNQRNFDQFLADYDVFNRDRKRAGDYLQWGAGQGG